MILAHSSMSKRILLNKCCTNPYDRYSSAAHFAPAFPFIEYLFIAFILLLMIFTISRGLGFRESLSFVSSNQVSVKYETMASVEGYLRVKETMA